MRVPALLAVLVIAGLRAAAAGDAPDTMLAAAIDRGGGPDVLSVHRLPVPKVNADQVLIAVHTAGVGVWEASIRQHPGDRARFPMILGSDGAGTVVALGSGVRGFKVGDEVYGASDAFYAEYVAVRVENITHIPQGVDLTEAGALAISGLSALQGIDDALQLKAGETLIIHGAVGGVGTLAIQFAKLRGAKRAMMLSVSAPFHCPLMQPAAEVMAEALAKVSVKPPIVPLVANVLARPITEPAEIVSCLVEQVTGTVRWRESILFMAQAGVTDFYEIGAGKVLTGLIKRIADAATASAIGTPEDLGRFTAVRA